MTGPTVEFGDTAGVSGDAELLADIKAMIRHADASAPRSRQVELGPSEVGHPCARRLAFGLLGEPKCNLGGDPLPAIVGTAAHVWVAEALRADNARLGRVRWVPETRVQMRPGLSGTCDCYDLDTATVIDWKFPGTTRMRRYAKHGPSTVYRNQFHLYGYGYEQLGLPVRRVGGCFLPRGGMLAAAVLWTEPYDRDRARAVLDRIDDTLLVAADLGVETHPDRYALIPVTPEDCQYCPWWAPSPTDARQCAGDVSTARPAPLPIPTTIP